MARGRNARRRRIGWTVAALAAAAVLSAALLLKTDAPPAPQPADAEALIDRFEKVAFRSDATPEGRRDLFLPTLYRWERPIRLSFQGVDEMVRLHALGFIGEIERLIGWRVWEVPLDSVTPANTIIYMLELEIFSQKVEYMPYNKLVKQKLFDSFCFVEIRNNSQDVENILNIYLNPFHKEGDFRMCILEELIQGVGLLADTMEEFDSLFIERGAGRLDFPLNDKILLRTLYDRRLRAGMKREEAMAKVALIIPELLAAYEAEGVAGLYQPLHDPRW